VSISDDLLPEELDWLEVMIKYNVPGGKLVRDMIVLDVYRTILGGSLTDDEIARASVLGCCIEFFQAFFLIADDIMDASQTRRGF
jgi:farnesyl diphosphate synthase